MIEIASIDDRQEDKERSMLKNTLKKLRKEREDESEARALLEEMQQILEEAHARASEVERKLCRELGEYTQSWEKETGRPHYIMDKIWQMVQSNDTKTMNLNKDFEELLNNAQPTGWKWVDQNNKFLDRSRIRSIIEIICAQARVWKAQ